MSSRPELLTALQVRDYFQISKSTLQRWLVTGLPSLGQGRLRRFDGEAVVKWFAQRMQKRSPPPPPGGYRCPRCSGFWWAPASLTCLCGGKLHRYSP